MEAVVSRSPSLRGLLLAATLTTGCGFPDYGFEAAAGGGATASVSTGGEGASDATSACEAESDCPPLDHAEPACFSGECVIGRCADGFASCDDVVSTGCESDLRSSIDDCGGCGRRCLNANGETTCDAGACVPACAPGHASCDGNPDDGCETAITTADDCGGCGVACSFPHGVAACDGGACALAGCEAGWGDCNDDPTDGCEVDLGITHAHCGGCGEPCDDGELCSASSCGATCAAGTANCNADMADGCEVDTDVAADHCGDCDTSCTADQRCDGGACVACGGALQDCNGDGADGCETDTGGDPTSCGACGETCGSDATCGCDVGACSGGVIHFSDDFSADDHGWTLAGEWQIGAATASSGHEHGHPDPGDDRSATADRGLLGVAIGSNYGAGVHDAEHATSPAIDLGATPGAVHLTYWRHLNADRDPLTRETVEVWNGSQWVTVWNNDSGNDPTTDAAWVRRTHDVTQHKNAAFRVRFGHETRRQGQSLSRAMSGWNVDDLSVSSEECR